MRSYGQYCAVAKALDVVGDRWTLLIVRELLLQGPCRYTDLQNGLPGIATNLLGDRLRQLEDAGLVWRESAPPPVAATLYHLSDAGAELEPVLRALGRWGVRFMPAGDDHDEFRSHWLAWPIGEFLADTDPTGPPLDVEVRPDDLPPAVIETRGGVVRVRVGEAASPELVLSGRPPAILGFLTGLLTLAEARQHGLRTSGDPKVLVRLRSPGLGVPARPG
ncbi:MAG TPA: helix-turn-helix domain-containing protein [Acidimicrobiales bacterium]|nr:helix-turn-helix domain-containing protein [Acidimicrobiales bacterium]